MIIDLYTEELLKLAEAARVSLEGMETGHVNLLRSEWTKLFVSRMHAHTFYNDQIKGFANKRVRASLDHAMVETIAMQLKAYLRKIGRLDMVVHAEKSIPGSRCRPDVSVWIGERCVAAIECKVQLGWDRDNHEQNFTNREAALTAAGVPVGNVWHVVASQCNWVRGTTPRWGSRWLVVGEEYSGHWKPFGVGCTVIHPIDPMYVEIGQLA
jgi:hypothetical protein